MNPFDDQLDRLFRAAGTRNLDPAPPFGLETRVLAAWRHAKPFDVWSPALLVRGLFVAFVVMVLSFLPLLNGASKVDSDYQQLVDSTLQVSNKL